MGRSSRRLRVSLRQLEIFVAVAQARSARAAADVMARSQSAASSALADLEAQIGHRLFDRVGRRLVLNECGKRLLPAACALLEQAYELECLLEAHTSAPLSIAASMTIGECLLPELLSSWHALHPESSVRMRVMNTVAVVDAVANLEADLGFVEGFQIRPNVKLHPWRTDELVIVARAGHPLAMKRVTQEELRHARWVLREQGSGTRAAAEQWLVKHLGPVAIDFELGSPQAIGSVVRRCDALTCLSAHAVAHAVRAGELVVLACALPLAQRQLYLITHADKPVSETCRTFIKHCMPTL